jgi:L-lysine exporter family protein LysE/ArgO
MVLTCLAFTWLNPHVYLDTVVLIGSISTQFTDGKGLFAAGATLASFTFFFSLGYGARLLKPLFARPVTWRVLDIAIGLIMWVTAAGILLSEGSA